jgi:spoIIIJ-associated protein
METKVEVSAKSLQEAIIQGAEKLGVGIDEVDFETLSEGGLFKKMKVLVKLKNDPVAEEAAADDEAGVALPIKEDRRDVSIMPTAEDERDVSIMPMDKDGQARIDGAAPAKEVNRGKIAEINEKIRELSHEVLNGKTEEFDLTGNKTESKPRFVRAERPVTEFNPDAPKFVKSYEFAEKLFALLGDGLTLTSEHNDREFIIMVHGEDVARLIGKEGHTLAAINTLIASVAIKYSEGGEGRRVVCDIENYRDKRRESLIELGKRKAEWVKQSGKTVKLEPMPARERVIIHTALQDMEGIKTYSQGEEPNRYLIVAPSAR